MLSTQAYSAWNWYYPLEADRWFFVTKADYFQKVQNYKLECQREMDKQTDLL